MGRKGASRNRGAGGAAAGQSQSGKKRGPSGFTLRNFAIAGFAIVFFFLLPSGPNTNQRNPHADDESLDHAELGSRGLTVRTST